MAAYEKIATWTLLYEALGLGCGSMPLTLRFLPPFGGALYWLRPGTIRLPPWPVHVPGTAGTRRGGLDVALYAGLLAAGGWLLWSAPLRAGGYAGLLPPGRVLAVLVLLGLLGLRDKVAFLAARPEHYAVLLVFCFPVVNTVFALKLVMLAVWWGAATSKLNRHFPYVVSVMISNTPWQRSQRVKRQLWREYPDDMRPSRLSELVAHGGTVVEFTVPLVLILSRGGWLTTAAVTIMVLFHVHITSTFPLGVPLEWNLFFIYSILVLFGHYAAVGESSLTSTALAVLLVLLLAGFPILGNLRPDLVSFLPSMRYYAGNWATSVWLFRNDGSEERFDSHLVKPAPIVSKQLTRLYDEQTAELLLYKGLAFRSMHSHGRALNGLLARAVDDLGAYTPREGELVAGVALGWNFGEGHLHNARLLDAVQFECDFTPGQLRVIAVESQPFGRPTQRYQILDAATGLLEEGTVQVADLLERQPWASGEDVPLPVDVLPGGLTRSGGDGRRRRWSTRARPAAEDDVGAGAGAGRADQPAPSSPSAGRHRSDARRRTAGHRSAARRRSDARRLATGSPGRGPPGRTCDPGRTAAESVAPTQGQDREERVTDCRRRRVGPERTGRRRRAGPRRAGRHRPRGATEIGGGTQTRSSPCPACCTTVLGDAPAGRRLARSCRPSTWRATD